MRVCLLLIASAVLACCADSDMARPDAQAAQAMDAAAAADGGMLGCVQTDPQLQLRAEQDAPVPAGTPVTYVLTIRDMDTPDCPASTFTGSVSPSLAGLPFHVTPQVLSTTLQGGERATQQVVVTSASEEEAGAYRFSVFVRSPQGDHARTGTVEAEYRVVEPAGCHVAPARELLIRDPSVVDDPQRTSSARGGAWSFAELMRRAARTPEAAPHMVERLLRSFTEDQTVNGFHVAARPRMQAAVIDTWPRTDAGELDLTRSPMRLLAIAPRLDLGEGRFVYGVLTPQGASLLFTLILEYALPGDADDWARSVHALQALPFPSEEYKRALQALTDRFSARGAAPERPNGSALLRVRSNENALGSDGLWEMRELQLSADSGELTPAGLALTPDRSWNGTGRLARFIDDNLPKVLRETHDVPARLDGEPFQAGSLINALGHWEASGVQDPEARRLFSVNTCDGCHGGETFTSFFHVFPRAAGEQSALSTFLTGIAVRDPVTGEEHTYNELRRRRQLLEHTVCGGD